MVSGLKFNSHKPQKCKLNIIIKNNDFVLYTFGYRSKYICNIFFLKFFIVRMQNLGKLRLNTFKGEF